MHRESRELAVASTMYPTLETVVDHGPPLNARPRITKLDINAALA